MRLDELVLTWLGSPSEADAVALADELALPHLSHDVIKERLADSLGVHDEEWISRLSDAADDVFFALVPALRGAVLDHWWRPPRYERLIALKLPMVAVFCRCALEVLQVRADARTTTQSRHPVHRDWLCPDVGERWASIPSAPFDAPAVAAEVRAKARG